jgi:phosphoribosylaminoimidazolecarboxamide formyltransferase/IMP cyclohydrolase
MSENDLSFINGNIHEVARCKYGENAYQSPAVLFSVGNEDPLGLDKFQLISGAPLSYNNYCDIDRLLQTVTHIAATFNLNCGSTPHIVVGAKHGNACGAGVHSYYQHEAIKRAVTGDFQALFGGLVMLNFAVDVEEAELLLSYKSETRRLLDGIIAPWFSPEAIEMLKRKGDKCRFVANNALSELDRYSLDTEMITRYVRGGFMGQPNYTYILDINDEDLKKYGQVSETQKYDMMLAKAICDTSNSNTITIVKACQLLGNGVGQQSRVSGAKLAIRIADDNCHNYSGAVAASDSFFPFTDGPEALVVAGITAILSTSGSVNDPKIIDYCAKCEVPLWLIPDTKGRGFYNH